MSSAPAAVGGTTASSSATASSVAASVAAASSALTDVEVSSDCTQGSLHFVRLCCLRPPHFRQAKPPSRTGLHTTGGCRRTGGTDASRSSTAVTLGNCTSSAAVMRLTSRPGTALSRSPSSKRTSYRCGGRSLAMRSTLPGYSVPSMPLKQAITRQPTGSAVVGVSSASASSETLTAAASAPVDVSSSICGHGSLHSALLRCLRPPHRRQLKPPASSLKVRAIGRASTSSSWLASSSVSSSTSMCSSQREAALTTQSRTAARSSLISSSGMDSASAIAGLSLSQSRAVLEMSSSL